MDVHFSAAQNIANCAEGKNARGSKGRARTRPLAPKGGYKDGAKNHPHSENKIRSGVDTDALNAQNIEKTPLGAVRRI